MIYNIFGFDAVFLASFLKQSFYVIAVGIFLNFLFGYALNQAWLLNFNNYIISTLIILSVFVITKVISNNIALSLGLVGALSIVRFRTPIKNPLELAYYFLLITFGIAINVDLNLSFNLLIFISVGFLITKIGAVLLNKFNFFDISYISEKRYYLILNLKSKDSSLEKIEDLINYSKSNNDYFTYHLSSNSKNTLLNLIENYDDSELINFELRKASNIEGYL